MLFRSTCAFGDDRTPELEVHLAVADAQVVVDDREQRREVGDRLVLGNVVVDAQAAAHVDETELAAQFFEVLDDDVDLVAHVLEDMQLADLRSDVQVQSDDVDVFERPDLRGVLKHFLVGDAELAVRLARVDAMVGLGVDVGVDAQRDVGQIGRASCRERV